jgi:lysozyme
LDFTYNLGAGAFEAIKDLNAGDATAAAYQFEVWDKAGGKTVAGLLRRREAEERLLVG